MSAMFCRSQSRRWRRCKGEGDFNTGMEFVDLLIEMGFDDAVVIDPKTFTERILGDFESAVHIASQGSGEKEADGKGQRS